MDIFWKVMLILGTAVLTFFVLFVIYYLIIWISLNQVFTHRQKRNPNLKYFEASDFADLNADKVELKNYEGITLRGYLYSLNGESVDTTDLIVFFHGWGMGHLAYTKEIRTLVLKTHKPVLAIDYQGCDLSDGKKTGGFYHALIDAKAIVHFAIRQFAPQTIHLVGHSWGGFVAANLLRLESFLEVKTITFISAPESMAKVGRAFLEGSTILERVLSLFARIRYGKIAQLTTSNSIVSSKIPTLFIHGEKDQVIDYKYSGLLYLNISRNKENIRPLIFQNKHHNPYLTEESEAALMMMLYRQHELKKTKNTQLLSSFYSSIDYGLLGNDDMIVFEVIAKLIKEHCNGAKN
ncbi:MAG: alpha/beta hydrolase [Bacilli bacterium]|jgi:pimeloyl-ACP methyl ester carboxylesterase|nr:alpha/beta hydrolase [Bacilli bacterium]MCH4235413.1 alpha/beta hydrolase [Bacilli bacterium]